MYSDILISLLRARLQPDELVKFNWWWETQHEKIRKWEDENVVRLILSFVDSLLTLKMVI